MLGRPLAATIGSPQWYSRSMSSDIIPSGQAAPPVTAQDTAFLRAQVEHAQSMQTLYLVLAAIAFIVALVQTFRLRRVIASSTTDPWGGWAGPYWR